MFGVRTSFMTPETIKPVDNVWLLEKECASIWGRDLLCCWTGHRHVVTCLLKGCCKIVISQWSVKTELRANSRKLNFMISWKKWILNLLNSRRSVSDWHTQALKMPGLKPLFNTSLWHWIGKNRVVLEERQNVLNWIKRQMGWNWIG